MKVPKAELEAFSVERLEAEFRFRSPFLYAIGLHYYPSRMIKDKKRVLEEIDEEIEDEGDKKLMIEMCQLIEEISALGAIDVMEQL